jgi:hypothetical protein
VPLSKPKLSVSSDPIVAFLRIFSIKQHSSSLYPAIPKIVLRFSFIVERIRAGRWLVRPRIYDLDVTDALFVPEDLAPFLESNFNRAVSKPPG